MLRKDILLTFCLNSVEWGLSLHHNREERGRDAAIKLAGPGLSVLELAEILSKVSDALSLPLAFRATDGGSRTCPPIPLHYPL